MLILKVAEYFCGGLTEAEKRQLFDEHVQWYRMYGDEHAARARKPGKRSASTGIAPVATTSRSTGRRSTSSPSIKKPKFVSDADPLWDQLFRPMVAGQRWIAAGLSDLAIRERAGMRWTPATKCCCDSSARAVEIAFWAVPDEIRLHPRALAAYRRAAGQAPADAPLVEAPFFMDPPATARHADALRAKRRLPFPVPPIPAPPIPKVNRRAGRLAGPHRSPSPGSVPPAAVDRPPEINSPTTESSTE